MSFTKILRNTTNALMMTKLEYGEHQRLVWSIDGNISYLSFEHLVLVVFSAIVLFFVVSYACVIFLSQWIQRYSSRCRCRCHSVLFKTQPFLDAYTGPYSDKHRYWTGLLLLIRLFLTLLFWYTSGTMNYMNNYLITLCELILVLSVLSEKVHRIRINYLYEKFFHTNLCILCLINSLIQMSSYKHYTSLVTSISVAIALFAFGMIIAQQIYNCSKQKLTSSQELEPLLDEHNEESNPNDNSRYSGVIRRRDSIIFQYSQ